MIFHFSPKPPLLSLSSSSLTSLCLRPFLLSSPKFPFYPSLLLKPRFSLACRLSTGGSLRMDSPSPDPPSSLSVDSVADGLKNQSLTEQDNDNINNQNKNVKLSLEDLNWDHSFVRELPGDPRSDSIPRQV